MNKVLVTGANGLIGSYIVNELSQNNIEVIAVIKDELENVENIKLLPNVRLVYCDLADISSLTVKIPDRDIDSCIYLAWAGASGDARSNAHLQLDNIKFLLETVSVISEMGIKKFIGAGTLMELDALNYIPEDGSIPNPVSHYPTAKIAARFMAKIECSRLGLEFIWCFISNTYGPGIKSGFIHYAIKNFLKKENVDFTSGEQLYDFVHVEDTSRAFVSVALYGKSNNSYYLGSSKPRKLKEFIMTIKEIVDPDLNIKLGTIPFRGNSLSIKDLDCTKLYADTGFKPIYTFEEGIKSTVSWLESDIIN